MLGFRQPRILLPEGLDAQLSHDDLRQVLLHEVEHIRRGDMWINLVQKALLVAFPLSPAMLFVERRLCLERELACDDRVTRVTGARKHYAACLARIAEHRLVGQGTALVLGAWDRRPELVRRVERLLRGTPAELTGWRARTAAGAVLLGALGTATTLVQSPSLVRFGPAPVAVSVRTPSGPELTSPGSYGRMQLVKATMPTHPSSIVRSRKAVQMRPTRERFRPHTRVIAISAIAHPARAAHPLQVAWHADQGAGAQDEIVLMPAVLYVVPTSRGWLVFQL